MKSFRAKEQFFWKRVKKKTQRQEIEKDQTADGKRQDEEGGEMGVWVVLSGGQGEGGGRICLC